ncbi:MAG: arsenite methyltransferase, partial [Dehalococcoidia bacterium]|nr:arsenite methyltransferase [Dehalococcoidia bacterium]
DRYGKMARQASTCCPAGVSCCGPTAPADISRNIGYAEDELGSVPEGANLGLGCGNPVALASLKKGEAVLDLGCGAGFDCFLAAARVGPAGNVIGVDMTPEMLAKARANARKGGYKNVEFRLGEIENLPVADGSVDVVISNCVINLSPDKQRVFKEAFRVLKPGGRLVVSDIVLLGRLPKAVTRSVEAYVGCVAGADLKERYLEKIRNAGFDDVRVVRETVFPVDIDVVSRVPRTTTQHSGKPASKIVSVSVVATKPE